MVEAFVFLPEFERRISEASLANSTIDMCGLENSAEPALPSLAHEKDERVDRRPRIEFFFCSLAALV